MTKRYSQNEHITPKPDGMRGMSIPQLVRIQMETSSSPRLRSCSGVLVSVDNLSTAVSSLEGTKPLTFLSVKAGDFVIVQAAQKVAHQLNNDWWMGQVVFCEGGARDQRINTMFQVSDVDEGGIFWVNGDAVTHVVR